MGSGARSWVRRRFSLEVSRPGSVALSSDAAAALVDELLDQRRGGDVAGAFTGTGFGMGSGEGCFA